MRFVQSPPLTLLPPVRSAGGEGQTLSPPPTHTPPLGSVNCADWGIFPTLVTGGQG